MFYFRRIALLGKNKVEPTYTAPTAKSLTYNGSAQALLNAGSTEDGIIYYSTDNTNWSENIPSGTNATSYTVYWKLVGDKRHIDIESTAISLTMDKANSSLSFAVTNITVEVGETKTNAVTVNAGDGTVTYSSNNTTAVTVNNSGTVTGVGVGNATITANISSTNNYNSASTSYTASCVLILTAKFNVTSTTSPTRIASATTGFSSIEIDGVVQPSVTTGYTFSTTGEHTVKYSLNSTSIGYQALMYCYSLTSIDIPYGVTSIDRFAFQDCSSLTSIGPVGSGASLEIPNSVKSIGDSAFQFCSGLTSIDIPDSVTSIGNYVFQECYSLRSVNIPSGVTSIGECVFRNCTGLTSITIPNGVTTIGNEALRLCYSLTSCTIGSGVTSIGVAAFENCRSLTSIDIPSGVTNIGDSVFRACTGLTSITVEATTPPTLGSDVFYNTNNCPIIVLCGTLSAYQAASGWSTYSNRLKEDYCYVEIGGVKWATMNVGATSVTDTGLYFQWGDTSGYTAAQVGSGSGQKYFGWADYKYGNGTSSPGATGMTKYNSTDGKTVLDIEDDAARANMGGLWRMPTTAEYAALGNATTSAWTADYQGSGVAGLVLTDKTDSSKVLFFPAAGDCYYGSVDYVGMYGIYWSSSVLSSDVQYACSMHFYSRYVDWQRNDTRSYGFAVRGVAD